MRIPKRYGVSKIENCPFCDKKAVTENKQCVPVCLNHKHKELIDLRCVCGDWLEVKKGRYGVYFYCMNCGNINFSKGMEMNPKQINKTSD